MNAWKKHQNTVYWADNNLALKKGLKFYQTRSNAIILHEILSGIHILFADHVHIDATESTTNSLSSGLRVDGAGKHQFSEGEKNAALFFSFNFWNTFGQPPRCFTGTSLLPFRLFLRTILKFWSVGATLMRFTWAYQSERRILVSNVCVTCNGFREFYTSDRFPYV